MSKYVYQVDLRKPVLTAVCGPLFNITKFCAQKIGGQYFTNLLMLTFEELHQYVSLYVIEINIVIYSNLKKNPIFQ